MTAPVQVHSKFSDFDVHLFKEGKHYELYKVMGSHPETVDGVEGIYFAVWAPSARSVRVIGEFNGWNKDSHPLNPRWDSSGIWEGFIPGISKRSSYKYAIETEHGQFIEKGDLYANHWETPPATASKIWQEEYSWNDGGWMRSRHKANGFHQPQSVYEVHIGSWRRKNDGNDFLNYRDMAVDLVSYVKEQGFTHVEFMPVMEHPFYGSWGYQIHGYFAPTSRFGTPEDFKFLVDAFHNAGIGVILDWVPSHFPNDAHGVYQYDGSSLYEHADPRQGFHPDWSSYIFNYGRNEVRSFLISNAMWWLEEYHIDGLRVDAVASMLYLDYSRESDQWVPNKFGGRENLEAISLLQELNTAAYGKFPDIMMIAEESTSWPNVSGPTYNGGLGFGQKWMMGWMNDTLKYFQEDPINRKYHHNAISFSMTYAFTENFMLPLSHDEVVHGKGALIERMPGDDWQRFANLRLLYGYMFAHPGTKLLFMGSEFGQTQEWKHDQSLDWHLLDHKPHQGIQKLIQDLNSIYRSEAALHEENFTQKGFEWIDYGDHENSVLAFIRRAPRAHEHVICVCNFTPQTLSGYKIGVPHLGKYKEILNSDDHMYWGSGFTNGDELHTSNEPSHSYDQSLKLNLPPLGVTILKPL